MAMTHCSRHTSYFVLGQHSKVANEESNRVVLPSWREIGNGAFAGKGDAILMGGHTCGEGYLGKIRPDVGFKFSTVRFALVGECAPKLLFCINRLDDGEVDFKVETIELSTVLNENVFYSSALDKKSVSS